VSVFSLYISDDPFDIRKKVFSLIFDIILFLYLT
jgi:hypothetical protein